MLYEVNAPIAVDYEALMAVAKDLPVLLGHDVPGYVIKSGPSSTIHAFDWQSNGRAHAQCPKKNDFVQAEQLSGLGAGC